MDVKIVNYFLIDKWILTMHQSHDNLLLEV